MALGARTRSKATSYSTTSVRLTTAYRSAVVAQGLPRDSLRPVLSRILHWCSLAPMGSPVCPMVPTLDDLTATSVEDRWTRGAQALDISLNP